MSNHINNHMKILCVIEQNSWINRHIFQQLRELGHDVESFYYGEYVGEFYGRGNTLDQQRKNKALLEKACSMLGGDGLDLIFCYVYDDFLMPSTAKNLSELNVPMVNYNVDMVNQWYRQTRTAKFFTRMLCAQSDNMQAMERYNPNILFWPMAGIPPIESMAEKFEPAAPVSFVGTPTLYRKQIISRLHKDGIPLSIYGKYWQENLVTSSPRRMDKTLSDLRHYAWPKFRTGGLKEIYEVVRRRMLPEPDGTDISVPSDLLGDFVPDGVMTQLFANSQINLGFTRMSEGPIDKPGKTQVKLRDFEVPLAGGFYLVERVPEYEEHFRPGVEVETWSTYEELKDKVTFYLKNPEACKKIAAAGKARAEKDHTWETRFSMLFSNLGIE